MTCDEARIHIGADPENAAPELLTHLQRCPECQAYREQMLALNTKIRAALELDWQKVQQTPPSAPPDTSASVVVLPRPAPRAPPPKHKRPRLFALAASIAAAAVIALTLWLSGPPESLTAEIARHVEGEPDSWSQTQPVDNAAIKAVLLKASVKLGPGMQPIVYASSCWFRGHFVPHLVVMTPDGPVTVMILVNEKVTVPQQFDESGFSGLLVPAPAGSVAVLSRAPMPLEHPAATVVEALQSAT